MERLSTVLRNYPEAPVTRMSSTEESPRKYQRLRALKKARVVFNDTCSTYDVVIRDISEGGVKMKLGAPFAVPALFTLMILDPGTGTYDRRACELRWQRGDLAGACFIENDAATPSAGQRLQRLQRKAPGA